jgi:hypothetical protein
LNLPNLFSWKFLLLCIAAAIAGFAIATVVYLGWFFPDDPKGP